MEVKENWLNWLQGRDTGISSKTMFSALTGIPVVCYDIPYDIADIGRCIRMLKACPELRNSIYKVSDKHIEWQPFIDCWKQLEIDYEECCKWEALSDSEQKNLKRRKHFYVPNDKYWNLMEQLVMTSRYLKGMRMQGTSDSYNNKPIPNP